MHNHLTTVVTEIESHAATRGWDQPPRLYALVRTHELLSEEPALAQQLNLPSEPGKDHITPVEQEPLPAELSLDDALAQVAWPEEVHGCAIVAERLMLPPEAEAELPADGDVRSWAAERPDREEVRLVVGVLRDGARGSAVRLRSHDSQADVLVGEDLAPTLANALTETLSVP